MRSRQQTVLIIFAVAFITVVMMACTKKQDATVKVSFSKDIIPIFETSCAINSGCHLGANNANLHINLDSNDAYNTIINKQLILTGNPSASLLYVQVSSNVMPKAPYSALSSTQVNLILNWIQQGGSNN
ncbi:MAG: hypothetical protein WCG87_09700 [Bacteroidota bacterium]